MDINDIINAPEFDPSDMPLGITKEISEAMIVADPEEEKEMFEKDVKKVLKEALSKHFKRKPTPIVEEKSGEKEVEKKLENGEAKDETVLTGDLGKVVYST